MSLLALILCLFGLTWNQVSTDQVTEAIIGGEYAKKGEFKYQAFLMTNGKNRCGGAILTDYYILTAAHCVTNSRGEIRIVPIKVIAGTNKLKDKHAIVVSVDTVYVHYQYFRYNGRHDIAILKLVGGLNLSANSKAIEKINLPKEDSKFDDVTAVISGYGYKKMKLKQDKFGKWEEVGGKSDFKLKYTKVKIIANKKCSEINIRQIIFPTFICGQIPQKSKRKNEGVCSGDSGGPLVYGGEVIGILSLSPFACDESKHAATYTRVSSYVNLIHNVINGKPGIHFVSAKVPR